MNKRQKKDNVCIPELRSGAATVLLRNPNDTDIENHIRRGEFELEKRIMVLGHSLFISLFQQLKDTPFFIPNTEVVVFEIYSNIENEYFRLGDTISQQIGLAKIRFDFDLFTKLNQFDQNVYLLNKIIYTYEKLSEIAEIDASVLKFAAENVIKNGFKVYSENILHSRNRNYEYSKMYIPFFGYDDLYIRLKYVDTKVENDFYIFRNIHHFHHDISAPEGVSIYDYVDDQKNDEIFNRPIKTEGWNDNDECILSRGQTYYYFNPKTKTIRVERA